MNLTQAIDKLDRFRKFAKEQEESFSEDSANKTIGIFKNNPKIAPTGISLDVYGNIVLFWAKGQTVVITLVAYAIGSMKISFAKDKEVLVSYIQNMQDAESLANTHGVRDLYYGNS